MDIKAKKSLGQNFLIDREVLDQIISTCDVTNKEILEIGPGTGNLTTYILKKNPKKVYVVEKDDELAILLKEKFENEIEIINHDILKVNEAKISKQKLTAEDIVNFGAVSPDMMKFLQMCVEHHKNIIRPSPKH